jgi:hypothetical protein
MSSPDDKHPPRQLLAFAFPPGAAFEGRLSTALQRMESGGALLVLEALFVGRDADAGELVAVSLSGSSAGMIGQLVGFRLDDAARGKETQRALDGPSGALVRELGGALEPGWSVAGLLVEHVWAAVLDDAVERIGGTQLVNELVRAGGPGESWAKVSVELDARLRGPH